MTKSEIEAFIGERSQYFDNKEANMHTTFALQLALKVHTDANEEITKLEQQIAYWKLSFHKQCETNRD